MEFHGLIRWVKKYFLTLLTLSFGGCPQVLVLCEKGNTWNLSWNANWYILAFLFAWLHEYFSFHWLWLTCNRQTHTCTQSFFSTTQVDIVSWGLIEPQLRHPLQHLNMMEVYLVFCLCFPLQLMPSSVLSMFSWNCQQSNDRHYENQYPLWHVLPFSSLLREIYGPILSNFPMHVKLCEWGVHCTLWWKGSHWRILYVWEHVFLYHGAVLWLYQSWKDG